MRRPLQVGITGGIGSGKSLVCRIFGCLGVPVYDADSRAKKLMTTDGILIGQIKEEFGKLSYHSDGVLNRKLIAEQVFREPEKLEKLNRLVHPRVANDYEQWVQEHLAHSYLIKEAALLFEAGTDKLLDKIIVVSAPEEMRIKRTLARDPQRSEGEVKSIIKSQMMEDEKVSRANYVILNDESRAVIPQVLDLHHLFTHQN